MRVCMITDGEHITALSQDLQKSLMERFINKGYEVLHYGVTKDDIAHCNGCFGCWIKTPGECIIADKISAINKDCMNSELVIYVSPIVFGGFSGIMKNTLDRSLPNVSPFFTVAADQTTHNPRYDKYPLRSVIGYGNSITTKEQNLFCQWVVAHGIGEKVYVYSSSADKDNILVELTNI